jgi:hypothetical protein
METTLHTLIRREFRAAMSRPASQNQAFDAAAARVLVQHPELSPDAARRLVAFMLSNEPLDIKDVAEAVSGSGVP